ncbi:MAG: helix-turn-helix domain-containing protein [Clostridiales bacterium]|jgi:transcriptional regulator with XRE-family HTH domain|nr:helix-turn-helix domain-containing protein [Clostridiales bacterium]
MKVTNEFAVHGLGGLIKAARLDKKLTREELSERVDTGSRHLMGIENKNKTPSFDLLFRLIRALELPADRLFYPEMDMDSSEAEQLVHMIYRCDGREIRAIMALVESLLNEKEV